MKKINVVKVVKYGSIAMTVLGTIGTAWVTSIENKETLAKLVKETLEKNA